MIGQTISHYRVIEKLGEGGAGVVYLAEDMRLGRNVALKALPPHATHDAHLRQRLKQEARAAAQLSHPGIAAVYDIEEAGNDLLIVYEYVQGETLRREIENGPLAPDKLVQTALNIARALVVPHQAGIVHRDLKPENVIRCRDGGIKILDFGLAHLDPRFFKETERLTVTGAIVGTVPYMSPEQIEGHSIDFRTDLFSLGILLYELASAVHPFQGSTPASITVRILTAEPALLRDRNPSMPDELDQVLKKCLRKKPVERYSSTADLVSDLERVWDLVAVPPASGSILRRESGTIAPAATSAVSRSLTPFWWWRFHQGWVVLLYTMLVYTQWKIRPWYVDRWGVFLFFGVLAPALTAGILRLHLWFVAQFYPDVFPVQMRRVTPWVRGMDWIIILALVGAAAGIATAHPGYSALVFGTAILNLIASVCIEPVTVRAAFGLATKPQSHKDLDSA
ncbi:MAG TPA: serine/threonine-protein kinase [Acidobacteriota bacterium]|jgi:serine/threonine protein kinase